MNIKHDPSIIKTLEAELANNSPIVIFGAGNLGRKIGAFLLRENKNVIGFSDNNADIWDKEILNLKVYHPKAIPESAVVIIGIWSPENSYREVKERLLSYGQKKIFHAAAVMVLYKENLLPYYHFQTGGFFLEHQDAQNQVLELLADEESKIQYLAHLDCRYNLNFDGLPVPDTKNQYFPADVVKLSDAEVFLDAGAYTGDTFLDFQRRVTSFKKYIALEPDPYNLKKLSEIVALSKFADSVQIDPFAVGAKNCQLSFDATGGGGAAIKHGGTLQVQCISIDDQYFKEAPTYLKFDIEGAELDALIGARQTILTHKPKMAICIYHLPDDLWTIPLFVNKEFKFYDLYVRTHQFDGLDFVLYAIPKS